MEVNHLEEDHMMAVPKAKIKDLDTSRGPKNRVPILRAIFLCQIYISSGRKSLSTKKLSRMASDAFKVQDSTSKKYVKKMCEWCGDIELEKGRVIFTGDSEKITYGT